MQNEIKGGLDALLEPLGIMSGPVEKLISALVILVIGLLILKLLMTFSEHAIKKTRLDPIVHKFVINCEKIAGVVILVITIISDLGVSTTPLVTVVGACGAAIALALKDSLGNFAGGILIIMTRIFKSGDFIETCGVSGKVQEIDLLHTKIITLDNKLVSIPNGNINTSTVINYNANPFRRIDVQFGISYGADIEHARKTIQSVIDGSDYFKTHIAPVIGVADHADSSIVLDTLVWCRASEFHEARYYLREQVKYAFDREGIEIPYPQITLHSGADFVAGGDRLAANPDMEMEEK